MERQYFVSSSITVENSFMREANMKCNVDTKGRGVAFTLRSEIIKAQKTPLPEYLTIIDVTKEDIQVPDFVDKIFNNFTCNPDIWGAKAASKVRRVNSVSEESFFALTSGLKSRQKNCDWAWLFTL